MSLPFEDLHQRLDNIVEQLRNPPDDLSAIRKSAAAVGLKERHPNGRYRGQYDSAIHEWSQTDNVDQKINMINILDPLMALHCIEDGTATVDLSVRLKVLVAAIRTLDYRDCYFDMFPYNPKKAEILKTALQKDDAPHLKSFLNHPEEIVRQGALIALGEYPDPDAIPITERLFADQDEPNSITAAAAETLARYALHRQEFPHYYDLRRKPFPPSLHKTVERLKAEKSYSRLHLLRIDLLPSWGFREGDSLLYSFIKEVVINDFMYLFANDIISGTVLAQVFKPSMTHVVIYKHERDDIFEANLRLLESIVGHVTVFDSSLIDAEELVEMIKSNMISDDDK